MSSPYNIAKSQGYNDEEIYQYLSNKDSSFQNKYDKAISEGYSPNEIYNYLGKEKKETLPENIHRQYLRGSSRALETVIGAPRAFGEFLESVVPEKALIKGAEKIGLGEGAKTLLETTKKIAPYKYLPEAQDVKKLSENLFGKKVKPQNEWEEKADTLISDFTALVLPIGSAKMSNLKAGILALGGNLASEGAGFLGASEKQKGFLKLGIFSLGALVNPNAANKLKTDLFQQAKKSRPADATIGSTNLFKNAENLEKNLLKGDPNTTSKQKSLQLIKTIFSKIKNKEIPIDELEQLKIDINEARGGLYETFKSDKAGRKAAKRNLDMVSNIVDDSLSEYGKINPKWEAFYRQANEVHGAISQSQKTRRWVSRHINKIGFPALAAELGLYASKGIPGVAISTGAGAGLLLGGELIAKIFKSPTLRKLYTNLTNAAVKENIVVTHNNLKKLNEELNRPNEK